MKEQPRHVAAYEFYRDMPKRSLAKVAQKFGVSETSINKWNKAFNWQERVMLHDQEVQKGVREKMMPEWIETKAYLLKVALEQVKKGRDAGVIPSSTRDMMAAIKEARSIMGETDKVEITGSFQHEIAADPDVLKTANELARKLSRNKDV